MRIYSANTIAPATQVKGTIESAVRILTAEGVSVGAWMTKHEYQANDLHIVFVGANRFSRFGYARVTCEHGVWVADIHPNGTVRGTPRLAVR